MPAEKLRVDEAILDREQASGKSRDGARDHECTELVRIGRKTERTRTLLIDANTGENTPEAGRIERCEEAECEHQACEREAVDGVLAIELQRAERRLCSEIDPVGAPTE